MPELHWIGKDKVINHHLDVPYHVLERQYSYDENGKQETDNGSENMIIHGDNLLALKSLLPKYEGKIDCIYIDPPYNTGNEGWVYNDNVNDPRIKKWLGEVVGKEGEDLTRHDKWLCMMYPRLRLLHRLLAPTGVLAISLSYHELHYLVLTLQEIFATRQIMVVTIQTSGGKPSNGFNISNEYLIFVTPRDFAPNSYGKGKTTYASPYHGMNLATFNQVERPNQAYPIYVNDDGEIVGVGPSLGERIKSGCYQGDPKDFQFDFSEAPRGSSAIWPVTAKSVPCVWRLIPQRLLSDWKKGYIKVVPSTDKTPNKWAIQYLSGGIIKKIESGALETYKVSENPSIPTLETGSYETSASSVPTIWSDKNLFTTKGGEQITDLFGSKSVFQYPKPLDLVKEILLRVSDEDSLILDSFAGSGTTAQAVLETNQEHKANRRFILIELGDYADTITAERVRRVIDGYGEGKKAVEGTGGSFSYYHLGEPLMIDGNLNPGVSIERVREYIWFTETGEAFTSSAVEGQPYFLGITNHTAYHFLYEPDKAMTLDYRFLSRLTKETVSDQQVVYADACLLSDQELRRFNITFKKIPRDITRL